MTAYDPKKAAEYHEEIHARVPNDAALRVKALESLLVEKGLVDSSAIDAWIEIYRDQVGPKIGARVVARAWNDAAYKARLLADGTAAIKELGIEGWAVGLRYLVLPQRPAGTKDWADDDLAALVTRNSMIGTERDLPVPASGA
jgi:Nitrile hydratase, alpha chain